LFTDPMARHRLQLQPGAGRLVFDAASGPASVRWRTLTLAGGGNVLRGSSFPCSSAQAYARSGTA